MDRADISFFDRKQPFTVIERHLPHWVQSGSLCFVTWRLADSLPAELLRRIESEINRVLAQLNLPTEISSDYKVLIQKLPPDQRSKLNWKLFQIRDKFLDQGAGTCPFRKQAIREIIRESLLHFDEERYFVTDLVVMPNHLHYLAAFPNESRFLKQNTDWKRYTARKVNLLLGRSGDFWQVDQFDHLVRSQAQFEYFRRYIRENPISAALRDDEFLWFSKLLGSEEGLDR